ncbi:hypothetical protein CBM2625_A160025 [Cupriavidus taiwanensis]|uniref:Uncharacterized protein n=1 Tax=Cupriavidus taiwanensis TaxID=164546 RepID=A0A375E1Q5_9BURK|nr:hypothetical protein CBM2613_A210025 [Cupriavidus taiwanensis]SPA04535.1 hypothetical protein CBM2625_A160025 [Cupriavidus taiwanensis]
MSNINFFHGDIPWISVAGPAVPPDPGYPCIHNARARR